MNPSPPTLKDRFPFCATCGGAVKWIVPEGDNRHRRVCTACDEVHYTNPHVVVGSVCYAGERILICRRAIEPRKGFWTLPAGFMERGEDAETGAQREAQEEAFAEIRIRALLGLYSLTHISQVQMMYLAELLNPETVRPGPESLEVKLVPYEALADYDLAFDTVRWAVDTAHQLRHAGTPDKAIVPVRRTKHE